MTKTKAVQLFGSVKHLAEALEVTPWRIYQWPEKLGHKDTDRVLGAAIRTGRIRACKACEKAAA